MDKKKIEVYIENNYDNLEIIKLVKYLLGVVVNDVDYMNYDDYETTGDNLQEWDLGNEKYIKEEDFESITSILDTLDDIIGYNEE